MLSVMCINPLQTSFLNEFFMNSLYVFPIFVYTGTEWDLFRE